jgi:hypothetical protein
VNRVLVVVSAGFTCELNRESGSAGGGVEDCHCMVPVCLKLDEVVNRSSWAREIQNFTHVASNSSTPRERVHAGCIAVPIVGAVVFLTVGFILCHVVSKIEYVDQFHSHGINTLHFMFPW